MNSCVKSIERTNDTIYFQIVRLSLARKWVVTSSKLWHNLSQLSFDSSHTNTNARNSDCVENVKFQRTIGSDILLH